MIVDCWITVIPDADRPYFSSSQPSPERKQQINEKGGKVFKAELLLPGYGTTDDGKIHAIAVEVE